MVFDDPNRMNRFARALGWPGLKRCVQVGPEAEELVWSESPTGAPVCLHVGCWKSTRAAVHSARYRIDTGYHRICFAGDRSPKSDAERLRPWLAREWFETAEARRRFRMEGPECARWTRARRRRAEEPYDGIDVAFR